jgi:cytochrome c oxidase accessory protein FixG
MSAVQEVKDGPLYAAHQKVHARAVSGRFNRLRVLAVFLLLGLYYVLPWVRWDGRQAVLFDLPARKFYLFGLTFFPQDFYLLSWLLIIAALALFFFTALAGRLWCGYACPQTVWTQTFMWIERLIEGDRAQRIKLDKRPWDRDKILRKSTKQFLWITFAFYTGFTFVGYFTPIRVLLVEGLRFNLGTWETFWVFFYGFATYGNAGYMREQVCKYMCPYARFQSAMFDKHSLVITYDAARGEPRGSRARGSNPKAQGLGDCIDCKMCVQVCPTGIDIRNGLQLECIACAACIDACDDVMDRMQYPRGLIRYTTQAAMEGAKPKLLRWRTVVYGTLLLGFISAFLWAIVHRELVEVDVMRDRNALYRVLDDGRIENVYTVRLVNKDDRVHEVRLEVEGLPRYELEAEADVLRLAPTSVTSAAVRIRVPSGTVSGSRKIKIVAISADDGGIDSAAKSRFLGPGS